MKIKNLYYVKPKRKGKILKKKIYAVTVTRNQTRVNLKIIKMQENKVKILLKII